MLPNEQFDAATHSYYRDGIWVPSVTQVLSFYSITKEGPEGPREHARIRGDIVHRMIEDSENGEKMAEVPEIPDGFTADEIWNRYSAWVRFRGDVRISELILEHGRIGEIDGYIYGVTPDVICRMEESYCVIELKNTYAPESTHPIQTAAQVIAALRPTVTPALWDRWKRFALYLKGDGSYRLKPHTDQRDFYVWRKLLAGHEEARRLRGEKVWSVQNAGISSTPLMDLAPIAGESMG